jgi:raffinose/stachyose/melibiose transport system permease protein
LIGQIRTRTLLLEVVLIALALAYLIPVFGLINVAFKDPRNLSGALAISGAYTTGNFRFAWTEGQLGTALVSTLWISAVTVVLIVLIGAMASYPLARVTARWPRWLFYFFSAGLIIPGQLALLPLFQTMSQIGLTGTPWSVILIGVGGGMPFTVFLCTTFIRELPRDYEEAAVLDGCSAFTCFWRVVVPLIFPVIATVGALNAVAMWNSFLIPLLYLTGSGFETAPLRINLFVGEYGSNWPVIFAALAMSSVPVIAIYMVFQKQLVEGFSGGIKT